MLARHRREQFYMGNLDLDLGWGWVCTLEETGKVYELGLKQRGKRLGVNVGFLTFSPKKRDSRAMVQHQLSSVHLWHVLSGFPAEGRSKFQSEF